MTGIAGLALLVALCACGGTDDNTTADGGTTPPQDGGRGTDTPQDGGTGDVGDVFDCGVLDCGAHGTCDATAGSCACDDNWSGAACDVFDCGALDCGAHGTCDAAAGNCACDDNWSGAACDVFDCGVLDCGAHGTCDATAGSCICDDNWSGTLCETPTPLEIIGSYVDDYGFDHEITQTEWETMGSVFHITQFSNADDYAVAQNDAANAYNPNLWSRFDWTRDANGDLFYCQISYDAATEAAALAATGADRGDLSAGCSGFAWSKLSEPLEIRGNWVDDYGFDHEITQTEWKTMGSIFHITQFSNVADFAVAQNDAANAYNPNLWSRFDWTRDRGGDLFYCQIAYDAATEEAALAATGADRGDLSTGCSGFAWSKLTKK
jgi:hypothetical protein